MKTQLSFLVILFLSGLSSLVEAQEMIISDDAGYTTPAAGAILDVNSTTKGLIIPRMTTAQRTTLGLTTPVNGVVVFDIDLDSFWYWATDAWTQIAASGLNLEGVSFGDASNYSTFEQDGTLLMIGDATVWEDLRISIVLRGSGGNSPVFSQLQGNLYAYKFSGTAVNEIYFELQMPHSWKDGTTIYPHVHWVSSGSSTSQVTWGLDYEWKNIGEAFTGTTSNITTSATPGGVKVHNINNIGSSGITESDKGLSSMIMCRLYRNGLTDANNEDCFLLAFDLHYEMNTIGSHGVLTK